MSKAKRAAELAASMKKGDLLYELEQITGRAIPVHFANLPTAQLQAIIRQERKKLHH